MRMMFMVTYELNTRLDWAAGSNVDSAIIQALDGLGTAHDEPLIKHDLQLKGNSLRSFQQGLRKWLETKVPMIAGDPHPAHESAQPVIILGKEHFINLWNDLDFAVSFIHTAYKMTTFANEHNHPLFIFIKPPLNQKDQAIAKAIMTLTEKNSLTLTNDKILHMLDKSGIQLDNKELNYILRQFVSFKLIDGEALTKAEVIIPDFKLKSLYTS